MWTFSCINKLENNVVRMLILTDMSLWLVEFCGSTQHWELKERVEEINVSNGNAKNYIDKNKMKKNFKLKLNNIFTSRKDNSKI